MYWICHLENYVCLSSPKPKGYCVVVRLGIFQVSLRRYLHKS